MARTKNQLFALGITLAAFAVIALVGTFIPEETIREWIDAAGPYAPFAYILLNLITFVIAPLNSTPLLFAGFYAFGPTVVWYAKIAAVISSVINFYIARRWGRSIVAKFVGEEEMHRVDRFTNEYGLWTLFVSRIFLNGLHDVISYASGLTSIKFWPYFAISTLTGVPISLLWYYVARQTGSPTVFIAVSIAMVFGYLAIFALGTVIVKFIKKKR